MKGCDQNPFEKKVLGFRARDVLEKDGSRGRQANGELSTDGLCVYCQQAFKEKMILLWTECLCRLKVLCWNLIHSVMY